MKSGTRLAPIILSFLLSLLLPFTSSAKDTIIWMEADAPPFFIHKGEFKGQGYEDIITDILVERLDQYNHKRVQASLTRYYQQWKQGEMACATGMYKTEERQKIAYFSIPNTFTLPPVLIIRKDKFEDFGGTKKIKLEEILKTHKLLIGRVDKRSYGKKFDAVLNSFGNKNNIQSFKGNELSRNPFKMLLAGRIDGLPGFPEEAMYLAETMGVADQIMTLTVEENPKDHAASLSAVACSKTEWGKKIIDEINLILLAERPTSRYRGAYERWLDESSIEGFRMLYKDVFLKIVE